jgi:protein BCP1
MLNLPVPLIPPLYKMLGTELGESGASFDQFILWGRGYKLEGNEETMGLELNSA